MRLVSCCHFFSQVFSSGHGGVLSSNSQPDAWCPSPLGYSHAAHLSTLPLMILKSRARRSSHLCCTSGAHCRLSRRLVTLLLISYFCLTNLVPSRWIISRVLMSLARCDSITPSMVYSLCNLFLSTLAMVMMTHFDGLNRIPQVEAQRPSFRSCCRVFWSSSDFMMRYKRQSSAKRRTCDVTCAGRSLQ